ncbi:MAG: S8 family serine peptidase, partial [Rhizobacter sp.]|nr:S8 family serine peptidase [Chlorobiales bacterium]
MNAPVKKIIAVITLLLIMSAAAFAQTAAGKITARLAASAAEKSDDETVKVMLVLERKSDKTYTPEALLSARAIKRREKMVKSGVLAAIITREDLPFDPQDLAAIEAAGVRIRHALKSLGRVSGEVMKKNLARVEAIAAVKSVDLLVSYPRLPDEKNVELKVQPVPQAAPPSLKGNQTFSINYGSSLGQLQQIGVPEVHNLGLTGAGVLVANFDNGFRLPSHESLVTMTIVATYDFVDKKVSVVPNNPSSGFGAHGTNTLSTVGGYKEGKLIGPAFGADYILARTENDSSETPFEEDNWAAAAAWADSIGADVITSSLGYTDFDAPYQNFTYSWQELDGKTAISTKAAVRAAQVGIVVCNSAGNGGSVSAPANTLGAPSDADTVISVGGVYSSGVRWPQSSVGPAADGRIKPDVVAQSSGVVAASGSDPTAYNSLAGTSFSCPLTAGVAALVLEANPGLTPVQVRDILRQTASNAASPNREYGWGIVNALAAVNLAQTLSASLPEAVAPRAFTLS